MQVHRGVGIVHPKLNEIVGLDAYAGIFNRDNGMLSVQGRYAQIWTILYCRHSALAADGFQSGVGARR